MSEIKVGEYIRPFDEIEKVTSIDNDSFIRTDKCNIYFPSIVEITKYSPNIIDLIECGDYVNGYKVIEKTKIKDGEMQICIYKDNTCSCWRTINNITLKSIVTKEQFEESEYKVC